MISILSTEENIPICIMYWPVKHVQFVKIDRSCYKLTVCMVYLPVLMEQNPSDIEFLCLNEDSSKPVPQYVFAGFPISCNKLMKGRQKQKVSYCSRGYQLVCCPIMNVSILT